MCAKNLKIKTFQVCDDLGLIEAEVNNWIKNHEVDITDIKLSCHPAFNQFGRIISVLHIAVISYKETEVKE